MINICDVCKQYVCPSACPNYSYCAPLFGADVGACSVCSERVCDGDEFYVYNERLLCAECAGELIPSELLSFLLCDSIAEFFEMLW